jgi:hypothetical protein
MSRDLTVFLSTGLGKYADDSGCSCLLTGRTAMALVDTAGAVTIRVPTIEDARALLTAAKAAYAAHEAAAAKRVGRTMDSAPVANPNVVSVIPLVGGPGINW